MSVSERVLYPTYPFLPYAIALVTQAMSMAPNIAPLDSYHYGIPAPLSWTRIFQYWEIDKLLDLLNLLNVGGIIHGNWLELVKLIPDTYSVYVYISISFDGLLMNLT